MLRPVLVSRRSVTGPLAVANNLSDLNNAATARANLFGVAFAVTGGPGEIAAGQALGPGNGAVSLALPFDWTGTAVVNWTAVPSTE